MAGRSPVTLAGMEVRFVPGGSHFLLVPVFITDRKPAAAAPSD